MKPWQASHNSYLSLLNKGRGEFSGLWDSSLSLIIQFPAGGVCHPTVSTALASSPLPSPRSTDSQAMRICDLSAQQILGLCTQQFSSSLGHWGKGAAATSWRAVRQDRSCNWFCWKRRKGCTAVLTSGRLQGQGVESRSCSRKGWHVSQGWHVDCKNGSTDQFYDEDLQNTSTKLSPIKTTACLLIRKMIAFH